MGFSLFGVSVATIALVDPFEDMDIFDELPDVVFVLFCEYSLFVVVEHE